MIDSVHSPAITHARDSRAGETISMTRRSDDATTPINLDQLRTQLLAVARRRVPADAAEDLVQDALRIIAERGWPTAGAEADALPPVAWCLQVLRNVIGNHYQRAQTRRKYLADGVEADRAVPPLEALERSRRLEIIEGALARLEGDCGRYLGRLADGAAVKQLAAEVGLAVHALYQRLYRCRAKLREILRQEGVLP
jgi:RNA polymerase sigma factor (sigma-70 family)